MVNVNVDVIFISFELHSSGVNGIGTPSVAFDVGLIASEMVGISCLGKGVLFGLAGGSISGTLRSSVARFAKVVGEDAPGEPGVDIISDIDKSRPSPHPRWERTPKWRSYD